MPLIKRHNRMMMELLSPCYVNQEATQPQNVKRGKSENVQFVNPPPPPPPPPTPPSPPPQGS